MGCVIEQGQMELIDRIGLLLRKVRSTAKCKALQLLREYNGKLVAFLGHPSFRAVGIVRHIRTTND